MANITAIISANTMPGQKRLESVRPNIFFVQIDGDPTIGSGVVAPVGSFAVIKDIGTVYLKLSGTNTDWRLIADGNGLVSSAFSISPTEVTGSSYTALVDDTVILSNPTSDASVNITLPSGEDHLSKEIKIKDTKGIATQYNITITPDGAETIDQDSQLVIDQNFASVTLIYADGNWNIF